MLTDTEIALGDAPGDGGPRRLFASLLASVGIHALAGAAVLGWPESPVAERPRAVPIPVSLVSLPGGGGGGAEGDISPHPAPAAPPPPPARPKAVERAFRRTPSPGPAPAREAPSVVREEPATAAMAGAAPAGGGAVGAGASGGGDGSGGDGSGGARPAYGSNPRPPYPLAARRLGLEGRVLLEVVVRPDGRPGTVRVRESSGHDLLDGSAVQTVRERWRFLPARRGGVPVESTVTVPIRFRLARG